MRNRFTPGLKSPTWIHSRTTTACNEFTSDQTVRDGNNLQKSPKGANKRRLWTQKQTSFQIGSSKRTERPHRISIFLINLGF